MVPHGQGVNVASSLRTGSWPFGRKDPAGVCAQIHSQKWLLGLLLPARTQPRNRSHLLTVTVWKHHANEQRAWLFQLRAIEQFWCQNQAAVRGQHPPPGCRAVVPRAHPCHPATGRWSDVQRHGPEPWPEGLEALRLPSTARRQGPQPAGTAAGLQKTEA